MIWGGQRARDRAVRMARARAVLREDDRGARLRACANNMERAELCRQWSGEARDRYYQGIRDKVHDVLMSESPRYRGYDIQTRELIGLQQWSASAEASALIGAEQMYARWAQMYAHGYDDYHATPR